MLTSFPRRLGVSRTHGVIHAEWIHVFCKLSHLALIISSYRREVQMFRKAQWTDLYSTHAKSQWVEMFLHTLNKAIVAHHQ
jgi:hypothetical protein